MASRSCHATRSGLPPPKARALGWGVRYSLVQVLLVPCQTIACRPPGSGGGGGGRSYGPLTHPDVGRKSKTWSLVVPLVSTPAEFVWSPGYSLPSTSATLHGSQ